MATWAMTKLGGLWIETCCRCGTPFGMADAIYAVAQQKREGFTFHCPNGHPQHYVTGESETDKLRRERDRLAQRVAEWQDEATEAKKRAEAAERRTSAARGQITRLKKRAAAGVCPCCNRQFTDLHRHMSAKHPGFVAEADAAELVRH